MGAICVETFLRDVALFLPFRCPKTGKWQQGPTQGEGRESVGCAYQKVGLTADQQILTRDLTQMRGATAFAQTQK